MGDGKWKIFFTVAILCSCLLTGCRFGSEKKKTEKPDYMIGTASDNAPYFYVDERGKEAGIYVEIMDALAEESSFSYCFEEVDASAARQELESGNIDGFLGTFVTETGEESGSADRVGGESENTAETAPDGKISQSESFYESRIVILAAPDSGIKKLKGLKDQTIAARGATGEERTAAYLAVKYGAGAVSFASVENILTDEKSGYSQAAAIDAEYYEAHAGLFADWKKIKTKTKWENAHTLTVQENTELLSVFEENREVVEKIIQNSEK